MTRASRAASATVLAIGPSPRYQSAASGCAPGTRPYGALNPTVPVKAAGSLVEPAMSEAVARGANPAASAAADPPDDPPGESSRFQGLRVTPHIGECVMVAQLNSGEVALACTNPPARGCGR
jgi:hypothetical protein